MSIQSREVFTPDWKKLNESSLVFLPFNFAESVLQKSIGGRLFGESFLKIGRAITHFNHYILKKDFYGISDDVIFFRDENAGSTTKVGGYVYAISKTQVYEFDKMFYEHYGTNRTPIVIKCLDQRHTSNMAVRPILTAFTYLTAQKEVKDYARLPVPIRMKSESSETFLFAPPNFDKKNI